MRRRPNVEVLGRSERLESAVTFRRAFAIVAMTSLVLAIGWWWFYCGSPTTLIVVRHADRLGTEDALNAPGMTRAQELAHVGGKAGIAAIYRSDTNRARDTAAPLAAALGLTPTIYPANETTALLNHILAAHRGQKVFIVGHSNTVPAIVAAAGGPVIPNIADNEFDDMFVLTTCRCSRRPVALVNLQYGAASP
jgi:phosphohistidine phosphatase SixA